MSSRSNEAIIELEADRQSAKAASRRKIAAAEEHDLRVTAEIAGLQAKLKAECAERRAKRVAP